MLEGSDSNGQARSVIYCLVPPDLPQTLHVALRDHYRRDDSVRVVVERRRSERRRSRRRTDPAVEGGRRRIRNEDGRRVADRRAPAVPVDTPDLPRKARRYAERLVFIERVEPSAEHLRNVDANRLIARYQAGDDSVLTELYIRYFDSVFGYARVALRDPHEAENVTQQVFTSVFQALGGYEIRREAPFRAWLFGIARHAAIDAIRQRQRLCLEDPASLDARRDAAVSEEAGSMLSWLTDSELSMFVERLPGAQREALVLRFMLDLSAKQIAALMKRTPKAVQRLQERGLRTLEQRLVAAGRRSTRRARAPMLVRLKPAPVLAARRFALWTPGAPGGLSGLTAAFRRWGR